MVLSCAEGPIKSEDFALWYSSCLTAQMRRFYIFTRDLHLYFGLFISPFVVVFAISVFFLVHAWVPGTPGQAAVRTVENLALPDSVYSATGAGQVEALRPVLAKLGVAGEVNFIRRLPKEHRLVVPVLIPGRETTVDLNFETDAAVITERRTGAWDALVYLHKMPGPHNAILRGNSLYIRIWKWLANATAYLLVFISISGIYLWTVLRAERRIGFALIAAGAFSFFGIIYAFAR